MAVTNGPVCGVTKTLPDDPSELTRMALSPAYAGATITCEDAPHACLEEEVVHSGLLLDRAGGVAAVHYWGPGWRPIALS